MLTSKGRLLLFIEEEGQVTKVEIMAAMSLQERQVKILLRNLRADGLVVTVQGSHGSRVAWYELADGVSARDIILDGR